MEATETSSITGRMLTFKLTLFTMWVVAIYCAIENPNLVTWCILILLTILLFS